MINVKALTFNAFQENTYVVWDDSRRCILFDPGNSNDRENRVLTSFLEQEELVPARLINTHCHIDHVLGNHFVSRQFGLKPEAHRKEIPIMASCTVVAGMYGIAYNESPPIGAFLEEGQDLVEGAMRFKIFFTPGHSPGSLCFYQPESKVLIGGDVLFYGSIGRTDLPGGNHQTLISSIEDKLMNLADDTVVYPGHGPETSIGFERRNNPFINAGL